MQQNELERNSLSSNRVTPEQKNEASVLGDVHDTQELFKSKDCTQSHIYYFTNSYTKILYNRF
jgi:hypothetical protein